MIDTVDAAFLARLTGRTLEESRRIRRDMAEWRGLAILTSESMRRVDRRVSELRDDPGMMLKSELMGRFAHLETRLDERFGRVDDRLEALEIERG